MKILFTNTIFFQQKKGGVSRYFINLANELALLKKNFNVFGILRRNSTDPFKRLDYLNIKNDINFISLDISESKQVDSVIRKIKPAFFFNLAAQSFVGYSFDNPIYTDLINNNAVINF
jgi:GDPmannose 4,6-dehydratase